MKICVMEGVGVAGGDAAELHYDEEGSIGLAVRKGGVTIAVINLVHALSWLETDRGCSTELIAQLKKKAAEPGPVLNKQLPPHVRRPH